MNKIFGTSWKTSLAGYVEAAFLASIPVFMSGDFELKRDWPFAVAAAMRAIQGRIQKDSNGVSAKEAQVVKEAASILVEEKKF